MKSSNFSSQFMKRILAKNEEEKEETSLVPPMQEMLKELMNISDETWGHYAFLREPLKGKIAPYQKDELIEKANLCGKDCARKMRETYGQVDAYTLASELGLKVDYPNRPNGGGHIIFAQFVEPNLITVFKDSVDKASARIKEDHLRSLFGRDSIEEILLAHEIFHFIEEQDKEMFTRSYKIRLWQLGPIKNDSQIVCLGEIAAMAFAKEFLKLNYSPYVLDAFLVFLYHPQVGHALYNEVMSIAEKTC